MKVKSKKIEVQFCKKLDKMFGQEKPDMDKINAYVDKLVWKAYDLGIIDCEDYNQWDRLHHEGEIFKQELKDWYTTFMFEVGAFVELTEKARKIEIC